MTNEPDPPLRATRKPLPGARARLAAAIAGAVLVVLGINIPSRVGGPLLGEALWGLGTVMLIVTAVVSMIVSRRHG